MATVSSALRRRWRWRPKGRRCIAAVLGVGIQVVLVSDIAAASGPARQDGADVRVRWGRTDVDLSGVDHVDDRRRVARYLRQALPLLDGLYGPPRGELVVRLVKDRSLGDQFSFSVDACATDGSRHTVRMGKPADLSFYVRALATFYRGCTGGAGDAEDRRLTDGMSEAVNQLVLQALGVRSPWRMERVQYTVANRPGLGAGSHYATDTSPELVSLRFQILATAMRIFEEDHPGFLRTFNAGLATRQSTGGAGDVDHMTLASELEPSFAEWVKAQHVFDPRPRGDQLILVAQGDWVRVMTVKRDESGRESARSNLLVTVRVEPMGHDIRVTTDDKGEATFELTEETYVRPGRIVTMRANGAELRDQLTFMPVPPEAGAGGPPHPADLIIWFVGGGSIVGAWWSDRRRGAAKAIVQRVIARSTTSVVVWSAWIGVATLCCWVGAGAFTRAMARFDNARWVKDAANQAAGRPGAEPAGRRSLITGRIDPRLAAVDKSRGFVLYVGEYYSTEDTWEWDYTMAPPFTVVTPDGPVEIVNGCQDANAGWTIAAPAYNDDCYKLAHLPVTEYNGDGNDRFRGFKPGDPVVVFGVTDGEGIAARAVSGGSVEELAAEFERDGWTRVATTTVWLGLGTALCLRTLVRMRRANGRRLSRTRSPGT